MQHVSSVRKTHDSMKVYEAQNIEERKGNARFKK
jgi:hypothetical protein